MTKGNEKHQQLYRANQRSSVLLNIKMQSINFVSAYHLFLYRS